MPPSASPASSVPSPFGIQAVADRRAEPRLSAEVLGLNTEGRLAAGVRVRVINVSQGGALLEQGEWLRPGTRTDLRVTRPGPDGQPELIGVSGVVGRCWVHRLSPLRYRTALVFSNNRTMPAGQSAANDESEVEILLEELSA